LNHDQHRGDQIIGKKTWRSMNETLAHDRQEQKDAS
jgi:hypothetical protein